MATVKITLDGKEYEVDRSSTILEAARANHVRIPTLCTLKGIDPRANCRMCVVEVEGMRTLQPACATSVREGMVIHTKSERVSRSRKTTLELLLADHAVDCHHCLRIGSSRCDSLDPEFCEMCFFCDCVRDGFCELQALAREYKVDQLPYEIEAERHTVDDSLGSVIRNANKCVKCRRCVDICDKIQRVHNLAVIGRGNGVKIGPLMGKPMRESECIRCGKCVEHCPTGALYMQEHKDELVFYAHDYKTYTAMQISSAAMEKLSANLAKTAHPHSSDVSLEMLSGSLKKIGIDAVYSQAEAAAAARRQAAALLEQADFTRPVILTNSFAAKNFLTKRYAALKDSFAFYPSAQEAFGKLAREAAKKAMGGEREQVKVFHFASNNEDGAESLEEGYTDLAINANELLRVFQRTGAEPRPDRTAPLDTFGVDTAETPYPELLSDVPWSMEKDPGRLCVTIKGTERTACICTNLGQADDLLCQVMAGKSDADIIRVIG